MRFYGMLNIPGKKKSLLSLLRFNIYRHLLTALLVGLLFLFRPGRVTAQVIWAGIKVGGQVNLPKIDDKYFSDTVKVNPTAGFTIGGVVFFKVRERYFLQTEYVYSLKSKNLTGKTDKDLTDKTTYQYIELPILFSRQAKGHFAGGDFKWYFGAGPNIAYLLSGKGVIQSSELKENKISELKYNVKFGSRPDNGSPDLVYYPNANRFQFGINLGTGLVVEPSPKQKFIIDLRYTFDQTVFARNSSDYLIPHDYNDNLHFRNRTLRLSVMYLMEYNISKKSRHTGKSTKKIR